MQTINPLLASILRTSIRAPRVYGLVTIPLVTDAATGAMDYTKIGSQLVMENILSLRRTNILEPGSDTLDLTAPNQNGELSPLSQAATVGRYFYPGAVDNKIQLYMGLVLNGPEVDLPKGVYIIDAFDQANANGQNIATLNCFDNMYLFQGDVSTQFPPKLYGNQQSSYFNPNYAMYPINASGGTATEWGCDAVNWMQNGTDNKVWSTDFIQVAVYVSTDTGGGSVPTTLPYTINYPTGTITFTTALPTTTVVSVDARPLGMAPEKMLYHLFVDFGNFDPASLKIDASGIVLPVTESARERTILDAAKEIVFATAPKGSRWRFYFDENGSLIFTEDACDGPPVRVFADAYDILSHKPEFTAKDIHNVVRATGRCITDQTIEVIAFDVRSINVFAQRATFDVPTQLLATLIGMDPGSAVTYLNGLTSSLLFEYSTPTIQSEIEIVPDPSIQVDDLVWVRDVKTGTNNPFVVQQITDDISTSGTWKETLRIEQFKSSQDYMFGLGVYTGAPLATNPTAIQTASGLIQAVVLNGDQVVTGGQPVLDSTMSPAVPTWDGISALPISITVAAPPGGGTGYLWRWIYVGEDAYVGANVATGDGSGAGLFAASGGSLESILTNMYGGTTNRNVPLPYTVLNNVDSPRSRRFFRPLLRCSDWLTGDGVTGFTTLTTYASSWTGGVGASQPSLFGMLRVGLSDFFGTTTTGYVGQALYAAGTPAATALGGSSTTKYGVDFGTLPAALTVNYGIHRKVTPAYLCILCANTGGSVQYKRIPFSIAI